LPLSAFALLDFGCIPLALHGLLLPLALFIRAITFWGYTQLCALWGDTVGDHAACAFFIA
jgi:hypothetical protein